MSRQQTRHREIEHSLIRAHEQRDAAIIRLVRAEVKLRGLLKAKARLEKAIAKQLTPAPVPVSVAKGELLPKLKVERKPDPDDAIPAFLARKKTKAKAAEALAK